MQEGILTLTHERIRQSGLWYAPVPAPSVLSVDEDRRAYKRAFASTLLAMREGHGSQAAFAKIAETSEATYRRWENPEEDYLPDAWEIARICDHVGRDASDLVFPKELSPREWALTKRAARASARGTARGLKGDVEPS